MEPNGIKHLISPNIFLHLTGSPLRSKPSGEKYVLYQAKCRIMRKKNNSDRVISVGALIVSIISIGVSIVFSIKSCGLENKLNKLHVDPALDYYLVRSIDKKGLEFYLKNKSPIPVVNLSVSYKKFDFSVKSNKYIIERPAASSIFDSPGENWIFKPKLNPNEPIGKKDTQIISMFDFYKDRIEIIVAAIFEITFYRESDMKRFDNKAIFFFDGERIFSYKNALTQENLKAPIEQLSIFEQRLLNFRKDTEIKKGGSRLFQKAN